MTPILSKRAPDAFSASINNMLVELAIFDSGFLPIVLEKTKSPSRVSCKLASNDIADLLIGTRCSRFAFILDAGIVQIPF